MEPKPLSLEDEIELPQPPILSLDAEITHSPSGKEQAAGVLVYTLKLLPDSIFLNTPASDLFNQIIDGFRIVCIDDFWKDTEQHIRQIKVVQV